ncbi:hypothetical protein BSKO_11334 [Bryopsis sp. KO-2023]|nr:hypothetical protein BSKO_11334 [Bryopsis sp. KO-2023]
MFVNPSDTTTRKLQPSPTWWKHTPNKTARWKKTRKTPLPRQNRCGCQFPSNHPSPSARRIQPESHHPSTDTQNPLSSIKKNSPPENMPSHLLSSLLVTYSLTDRDHYGIRAVVPRAVPLSPDFHPKVTEYRTVVPWWVHEVELDTPHASGARVEVTGNRCLKKGWNVVKVVVRSPDSRQTLQYTLMVKRQSEGGVLRRFGFLGVASAFFVTGLLILTRRRASIPSPSPATPSSSDSKGIKMLFHSVRSLGKL